jgi:hypothetical protein
MIITLIGWTRMKLPGVASHSTKNKFKIRDAVSVLFPFSCSPSTEFSLIGVETEGETEDHLDASFGQVHLLSRRQLFGSSSH